MRRNRLPLTFAFVGLFFIGLIGYKIWTSNPSQPAPVQVVGAHLSDEVRVTPLSGGEPRPLSDEIIGVTVINVFGSWCAPCRAENPVLLELRAEGVRLVGLAVRDEPAATRAFLDELGDPFFRVMLDTDGSAIESLGLGPEAPQTLVISAEGEILYRHSGPLIGTDGEAALAEIRELAGPR